MANNSNGYGYGNGNYNVSLIYSLYFLFMLMSSQLILASAQGQLRHTTGKWENELLGIVIWLNFMHMTPMTQIALQTTATTKTTTATENVCNV